MIWMTVLTLPSRPQYLAGTLENLDVVGGGAHFPFPKIVCADGEQLTVPLRPGWAFKSLTRHSSGNRMSLWRILKSAGQANLERLLYFEDDIRVSPDALAAMMELQIPRSCGFVTFCNQKGGFDSVRQGFYMVRADDPENTPGHWGCQALVIPSWSLSYLHHYLPIPTDQYRYASDVYLGQILASRAGPTPYYGIVIPSLARHIGELSTIASQKSEPFTGHRLGLNYAGDDVGATRFLPLWSKPIFLR